MTEVKEVPLDRLSFSRANTLRQCGEKWRLTYAWGIKEKPAWWFIGGNAVHEITEAIDLNDHGIPTHVPTPEEAIDALVAKALDGTEWTEADIRAGGRKSNAWPEKESKSWWLHHIPGMVESWRTWRNNNPWQIWVTPDGEPAVELEVRIEMGEGPDKVNILGYIDRVFEDPATGRLIVVDLKSGSSTPDSTHQLGLYRLGIWQKYEMLAEYGAFYSARTGMTGEVHDLSEWTQDRFEWEYGKVKQMIRIGAFTPNVSSRNCGTCGVRDWCYAVGGKNANEVKRPWDRGVVS